MKKQQGFLVGHVRRVDLDLVVGVTVRDKQILIPIIVVIQKFHTPPTHQTGRRSNSQRSRHIIECPVVIVPIDRIHFLIDIRNKQVLPTILVVVGRIDTHPGTSAPVLAVPDTGFKARFFKLAILIHE